MKNFIPPYFGIIQTCRITKLISLALLLFVLSSIETKSQELEDKSIKKVEKDFFFVDPMVFYSKDQMKARLDVYLEIPLENLQFKKNYTSKKYDASISYVIKITNSSGEIVSNESIKDFITTSKAEQKKLDESAKFIVKEFYLNPGNYNIEVSLTDINTKKEKSKKDKIDIIDYAGKTISFSDIMLVSNLKVENGKKIITPLIDKNIDNLKEIFLFFEIYNSENKEETNYFSYKISDMKGKDFEKGEYEYKLAPGINKFFEKITTQNLVFGSYKIQIKNKSTGEIIAEKEFTNKLNGFPVNMKDMNLLIDQLLYIATGEELSKIKNAPSDELKEKYFIEFWRGKDPNPYTHKNEYMGDYYKRIEIANERYTHWIDGWKTDMGMIYIVYGEPSNIERFPFTENTKPYEIWQYYSSNKEFIFVDDTGFGDYKLTIPIWDVNGTRIRN